MVVDDLYTYSAVIARVVDGDTLVVDIDAGFNIWLLDQTLRLNRVNAPEMKTPEGKALTERLQFLTGQKIIIRTIKNYRLKKETQKDSFGRYLSEVEVRGIGNLSDYLLANNLAVPYG
jgi:endonuclease YncB( thermonuclease family)